MKKFFILLGALLFFVERGYFAYQFVPSIFFAGLSVVMLYFFIGTMIVLFYIMLSVIPFSNKIILFWLPALYDEELFTNCIKRR